MHNNVNNVGASRPSWIEKRKKNAIQASGLSDQQVHKTLIISVISVLSNKALDKLNEPSRHRSSSSKKALVFRVSWLAMAYLFML